MIRKFVWNENDGILEKVYIGTDREIRSLYKELEKHAELDLAPLFCDKPKFRKNGMYGLHIASDGYYTVINSDTIAQMIPDFVEVKTMYTVLNYDYLNVRTILTNYLPL